MIYDHIIVGSGIAGSCLAYRLSQKSPSSKILIIDKNSKIADGASGAAGAFLSPLLGKPNEFKSLVNEALRYSVESYQTNFSNLFSQSGVLRIPKNNEDRKKFESYKPYMDFDYLEKSEWKLWDWEIRLADAFELMRQDRDIYWVKIEWTRYDTGSKIWFLEAIVSAALKRDDLKDEFRDFLEKKLEE